MMTADEIKHAVLRELAWDTRVEVTEVGVEVTEGVVTLTGLNSLLTNRPFMDGPMMLPYPEAVQ